MFMSDKVQAVVRQYGMNFNDAVSINAEETYEKNNTWLRLSI